MKKINIYGVFDQKTKEVITIFFGDDVSAERDFINNFFHFDWFEDLYVCKLSQVFYSEENSDIVSENFTDNTLLFYGSDDHIRFEIQHRKQSLLEEKAFYDSISKHYSSPVFLQNIEKLSRYLSKHDSKRFNK